MHRGSPQDRSVEPVRCSTCRVADGHRCTAGTARNTPYVLDEPTVGLHIADVEMLLRVLHRLVAAENSVPVIERNLDVIAETDRVVDLGPAT